ncbi:hypothetical protein LEP1GSC074_3096 [Leptospira noguchii str. Hook]|nr:hypothetical protein LEP1GSC074_3096 [Leptospira noguchii str. Hook]
MTAESPRKTNWRILRSFRVCKYSNGINVRIQTEKFYLIL